MFTYRIAYNDNYVELLNAYNLAMALASAQHSNPDNIISITKLN